MGGQACVFYGAAEFSRDCDIVVLTKAENLSRLEGALEELEAVCIAVPPQDWKLLESGHAIHFRCQHPEAMGIRLDVMSKLRGCDDFDLLWERRTTVEDKAGLRFELIGIEDLVRAKKTQREKDWPMIRRLVDAHYDEFRSEPNDERIVFWLRESRSPEVLMELVSRFSQFVPQVSDTRPWLAEPKTLNVGFLEDALNNEKLREIEQDSIYWRPLVKELESMRHDRRKN